MDLEKIGPGLRVLQAGPSSHRRMVDLLGWRSRLVPFACKHLSIRYILKLCRYQSLTWATYSILLIMFMIVFLKNPTIWLQPNAPTCNGTKTIPSHFLHSLILPHQLDQRLLATAIRTLTSYTMYWTSPNARKEVIRIKGSVVSNAHVQWAWPSFPPFFEICNG